MGIIGGKYFVKKGTDAYLDFCIKWAGLTIASITGLDGQGKPKNIYRQSWINSGTDDVYIPDTVYYETPEITISFIIRDMDDDISVKAVHDSFISYMTSNKVTIKSLYNMKEISCICEKEYTPTDSKYSDIPKRSWVNGTITLQAVSKPVTVNS